MKRSLLSRVLKLEQVAPAVGRDAMEAFQLVNPVLHECDTFVANRRQAMLSQHAGGDAQEIAKLRRDADAAGRMFVAERFGVAVAAKVFPAA